MLAQLSNKALVLYISSNAKSPLAQNRSIECTENAPSKLHQILQACERYQKQSRFLKVFLKIFTDSTLRETKCLMKDAATVFKAWRS